ncbi:MAG TPA: N-acetylmuramoyl-L-alanine amidase [Gammaproteobacteria bacterium]|nr:N-acetylmuramoyl-L-alanine amidase [Gammaproteobacteria bacterium]
MDRTGGIGVSLRRWVVLAAVTLLLRPGFALGAALDGVHVWSGPQGTSVVFDLSSPVDHRMFSLADPERVVVDLPGTVVRGNVSLAEPRGVVGSVRASDRAGGDVRVVLELTRPANAQSFVVAPDGRHGYQLVIDLIAPAARPAPTAAPPQTVEPPVEQTAARTAPPPVEPLTKNAAPAPRPAVAETTKSAARNGATLGSRGRDVIIAVDAGHGGDDPGASGRNGVREKDVVLAIARRLAAEIDAQPGMRAVLTRKGDYFVTLRKRMELAHDASADFFVSIHADAYRDSSAKGATVYVISDKGASDEAALMLAQRENAADLIGGVSLADKDQMLARVLLDLSQSAALSASTAAGQRLIARMSAVGTMRRMQVQRAPFLVLKSPDMPSVLVETAYISNPREEAGLRNADHQADLARALRAGIVDYFTANPPEGSYFASSPAAPPRAPVRHVIERGETLSGIAERYRVSMADLRRSNSLKGESVRVGQVLTIPF